MFYEKEGSKAVKDRFPITAAVTPRASSRSTPRIACTRPLGVSPTLPKAQAWWSMR